jgi:hypothetical protein
MAVPLMGAVIVGTWDGATEPKLEHDEPTGRGGPQRRAQIIEALKSAPNEREN